MYMYCIHYALHQFNFNLIMIILRIFIHHLHNNNLSIYILESHMFLAHEHVK